MLRVMTKLVGLITIFSIWMLIVVSPQILTQQSPTLQEAKAPPPTISIEALKSKRTVIERIVEFNGI